MWNGPSFLFIFILMWQAHFKREANISWKWRSMKIKMPFQNFLTPFQNAVDFQWWFDRKICWLRLIWDWSEIDLRLDLDLTCSSTKSSNQSGGQTDSIVHAPKDSFVRDSCQDLARQRHATCNTHWGHSITTWTKRGGWGASRNSTAGHVTKVR